MVAPSQRAQRCSSSAKPVPQRVAAHGELDQRFLEEFLIVVNSNLFPITLNNPTLIKH